MKKDILLFMFTLLASFFFGACTEENDEPYTEFKDYSTFSANRAAWIEPSNYRFTYEYGSPPMQLPVIVTVKNGETTSAITNYLLPEQTVIESEGDELTENLQLFSSITDIYDFFDKHWTETKASVNTDKQISFRVSYKKTENGITYPAMLDETVHYINNAHANENTVLYTKSIKISNFTVND